MEIIKSEDYLMSTWKGGKTYQLFIYPEDAILEKRDFLYRISIATCELEKNEFSPFEGYKRFITPLKKEMSIEVEGSFHKLMPFEVLAFDGSKKTTSTKADMDFNLIYKDGEIASMYSRKIEDHIFIARSKTLIYNCGQDLFIGREKFKKESAILLEEKEKVEIFGKGTILVCEMSI